MNQDLNAAARDGNIDNLYGVIQQDANILDDIDQVPFVDTPLHISAISGQIDFAMEIMRLKPSFAKKLNPQGYTPMHLALENNQTDMVFRLMDIDGDLVSVKGREGLTPLHKAASEGKTDILSKFLVCCPKSIKELTIYKESALHIAVRNGDLDSLIILLECIQQTGFVGVLNWVDKDGNNIMHLAALANKNKIDMVKLLSTKKVDMMSKNKEEKTALEIIIEQRLAGILENPRFVLPTLKDLGGILTCIVLNLKRLVVTDHRGTRNMSRDDRNTILVVSVLIATATYQALLTPPDQKFQEILKNARTHHFTIVRYTAIQIFRYFNTIAFLGSMTEIFLHLPSGIGYTHHLVLPLVICYTLLILFGWTFYFSYLDFGLAFFIVFIFIGFKVPLIRNKINGDWT